MLVKIGFDITGGGLKKGLAEQMSTVRDDPHEDERPGQYKVYGHFSQNVCPARLVILKRVTSHNATSDSTFCCPLSDKCF